MASLLSSSQTSQSPPPPSHQSSDMSLLSSSQPQPTSASSGDTHMASSGAGSALPLQKNPPLPEPQSQQQYVQFRKKGVVVLTQLLTNAESEWKAIEDKLLHRERIEKTKHLKHLLRRSDIPAHLRGLFWLNVSGADLLLYKNQSKYWHYVDEMYEATATREAKIKKIREQREKEKSEKKKMLKELLDTVNKEDSPDLQKAYSKESGSERGSEVGSVSSGASNNTESSSTTGEGDRNSKRKVEIWDDEADEEEDEATAARDREAETGWMSEDEKQILAIEKQIEKDLMRTGMDNEWIKSDAGVTKLRRLLVVYSRQNRDIGYCQAMHMLAAHFLLQMEEEKAFWMLTNTIESILPKDYYTEAMTGIRIEIGTFNEILRLFNPRILQHLSSMGILLDVFLTHWFLSLFINVLPDPTIIRVFDLFFFEGFNIIFRVVLGLLKIHEKEILGCTDPGKMMIILRDMPTNISYGELSDAMFSFKIIEKSKIESIKAVYTVRFAKENNLKLAPPVQKPTQPSQPQAPQQQQQQQQQSQLKAKIWPKKQASPSPTPEDNPQEPQKKFQFKQQPQQQQKQQQLQYRTLRKQTNRPKALIIQTNDKDSLNQLINDALSTSQSDQKGSQQTQQGQLNEKEKKNEDGSYIDPLGAIPISHTPDGEEINESEKAKSEPKEERGSKSLTESQIKEITCSVDCDPIPVFVSNSLKNTSGAQTPLNKSLVVDPNSEPGTPTKTEPTKTRFKTATPSSKIKPKIFSSKALKVASTPTIKSFLEPVMTKEAPPQKEEETQITSPISKGVPNSKEFSGHTAKTFPEQTLTNGNTESKSHVQEAKTFPDQVKTKDVPNSKAQVQEHKTFLGQITSKEATDPKETPEHSIKTFPEQITIKEATSLKETPEHSIKTFPEQTLTKNATESKTQVQEAKTFPGQITPKEATAPKETPEYSIKTFPDQVKTKEVPNLKVQVQEPQTFPGQVTPKEATSPKETPEPSIKTFPGQVKTKDATGSKPQVQETKTFPDQVKSKEVTESKFQAQEAKTFPGQITPKEAISPKETPEHSIKTFPGQVKTKDIPNSKTQIQVTKVPPSKTQIKHKAPPSTRTPLTTATTIPQTKTNSGPSQTKLLSPRSHLTHKVSPLTKEAPTSKAVPASVIKTTHSSAVVTKKSVPAKANIKLLRPKTVSASTISTRITPKSKTTTVSTTKTVPVSKNSTALTTSINHKTPVGTHGNLSTHNKTQPKFITQNKVQPKYTTRGAVQTNIPHNKTQRAMTTSMNMLGTTRPRKEQANTGRNHVHHSTVTVQSLINEFNKQGTKEEDHRTKGDLPINKKIKLYEELTKTKPSYPSTKK